MIQNAKRRYEHLTDGKLVLDSKKRREFAFAAVDTCISIYINGRVNEWTPVPLLSRFIPQVADLLPESVLPNKERHCLIAELLYKSGMKLGGLPVKAMQFMSLRHDLPEGYCEEFSKAQESTSFRSPAEHVQKILGKFPGLEWDDSDEFVKSASIAQVHTNCTWQGKPAVAKVQHAHVKEEYESDLKIMADLGQHVDKYEEAKGAAVMLKSLAEKLAPTVSSETDFTKEAANQDRIQKMFAASHSDVVVPEVFAATEMGLIMEKLPGKTAAEAIACWKRGEPLDIFDRQQRNVIYDLFAQMVLKHRFFQMDAHPGNFMALDTVKVALLDFGQCCEPSPKQVTLFQNFALTAPTSEEDAIDETKILSWISEMGVKVATAAEAKASADLLFFGQKSSIFPSTKEIDPELMPLLLISFYLSRFESEAAELRSHVGLKDQADDFAVLKAFRYVAEALNRA
ncbi:Protein ACTIVITY OF BC1 COMPLEX KINASE 8, partial [Durusdinium trenchii]